MARWLFIGLSLLGSTPALSQDPRLAARLDSRTATVVQQIVDSARAAGVSDEVLVAKALEGAARGVPGDRIISTVRAFGVALRASRRALGADAAQAEVTAGASAIIGGADPAMVAALRAARPSQSLTLPLVVLADLISRGVPPDTAAGALHLALRAGLRDSALSTLRRAIEQDILAGARPAAAAATRAAYIPGGGSFRRLAGDSAFGSTAPRPVTSIPP